MYLLDTNIWLERLLEQENSNQVEEFFYKIPVKDIFISDFSFHSICIILTKLKEFDLLLKFIDDLFFYGGIEILSLTPYDIPNVTKVIKMYNLDFDDAYQYVVSKKYNLTIVSFDSDFDKAGLNKKTPEEIVRSKTWKM